MGYCGCGADPMGHLWGAVAVVPTLWGIYGALWLRSGAYGIDLWSLWESMGCCGCGADPMGDQWGAVAAVWAYGISMGCCGCSPGPMGRIYGAISPGPIEKRTNRKEDL